jgi:hypothetical protein
MPVLDAKALETDPEGMAFLRAVLGPPAAKKQGSVSDACAEPRLAVQVATPSANDMPLTPATPELAAAASAAA